MKGTGENQKIVHSPIDEALPISRRVVDRRVFLAQSGKAVGGFLLIASLGAFVSSCSSSSSLPQAELDRLARAYYGGREEQMMGQMRGFTEILHGLMEPKYGKEQAAAIAGKSVKRYREMLEDDLPYIGGGQNYLQGLLDSASMSMAFCLAMKEHRKSIDEAGKLQYDAIEIVYQQMPCPADVKFDPGKERQYREQSMELAEFTQKRQYPYNWVSEFVTDVPAPFDYGMNDVECGNLKTCDYYGIRDFTKYLCMLDQIIYLWRGQGLTRTMTLADGEKLCDFRYRDDGVVELKEPFTVKKLREWGKTGS